MKKNGFISVSIVYSFLISFLLILALILASYANNRINLNKYKNQIKLNDLYDRSVIERSGTGYENR